MYRSRRRVSAAVGYTFSFGFVSVSAEIKQRCNLYRYRMFESPHRGIIPMFCVAAQLLSVRRCEDGNLYPHGEEPGAAHLREAGRLEPRGPIGGLILRDASLCSAPQDEVIGLENAS